MKKAQGYTLIELVIFIIITSLLVSAVLLSISISSLKTPTTHTKVIATQTAQECMEWLLGQRRINGFNNLACPNTTTPSFCSVPTGYNISTNISCTTIAGDSNYKTITVTVSGLGDATLTTLIGNY